jgi:asparagine synthase (glutamine-hydrolysing)
MQNQLLKDTDFMSMTHSLEIRVPFLDHVLVEYLSSLPFTMKLAGKRPKQLLIDAVHDILPNSVWERPKMGFTFPFEKWIKNDSRFKIQDSRKEHWSRKWATVILNKFFKND